MINNKFKIEAEYMRDKDTISKLRGSLRYYEKRLNELRTKSAINNPTFRMTCREFLRVHKSYDDTSCKLEEALKNRGAIKLTISIKSDNIDTEDTKEVFELTPQLYCDPYYRVSEPKIIKVYPISDKRLYVEYRLQMTKGILYFILKLGENKVMVLPHICDLEEK